MADHWINSVGTKAAEWRVDIVVCRQLTLDQASVAYNLAQTRVDITSGTGNVAYFDSNANFIAAGFKAAPNSNITSITLPRGLPPVQVNGDDANACLASVVRYTNDANGPALLFGKSRGNLGAVGIISAGDALGTIAFNAGRTSVWNEAAYARVVATGTVSNTAIPTKWEFGVTPASSLTPATETTIDERGTAVRQLRITGLSSPSSISTSQDNYSPTNWASAGIVRINATATLNITGFAAPASDGEVKTLIFVGTGTVTLKDESGSSTAANRLASSADIIVTTDDVIVIQYDTTSSRWRPIAGSKIPGAAIGTMAYQNANNVNITGGTAVYTGFLGVSSTSSSGFLFSSESTSASFSGTLFGTTCANSTHTAYTAIQHLRSDAVTSFAVRGDGMVTSLSHVLATNHVSTTVAKGTVGATSTITWTQGMFQALTLTSLTPLTLTFVAPPAPGPCWLKISAPAAGTSPTVTYPSTVKGGPPVTVTLGRYTLVEFFYDGTNYNYLSATQNVI